MSRLADDGLDASSVTFLRSGDLRYVGQGYELNVPAAGGTLDAKAMDDVWAKFHEIHAAEYGHAFQTSPIELVNLRVTAIGNLQKLEQMPPVTGGSLDTALLYKRDSVFRDGGALKAFETSVYRRDTLPVDQPFAGPAILLQKDSTTVVPPKAVACVHASGSIIIKLEGQS
jgi:N-methylhydantoinase A